MIKALVIDFAHTNRLSKYLEKKGCSVLSEQEDGARAYRLSGESIPDLIVVDYQQKASHGRQTASAIHQRKKTAHIPIYFVDGAPEENQKVEGIGKCIRSEEIDRILEQKEK